MREHVQALSARLGADPLLVQGAGGNISWKAGEELWVKASGMCMRDAYARDIFVPVNLAAARELSRPVVVDPQWKDQISLRPSIETTLHALMPHRVVVHLHSVALLSKLIMCDCETELAELLHDSRHALVSYRKPGIDLAKSVKDVLSQSPEVDVLLLANHGIVVAGDNVDLLTGRLEEVLRSVPVQERPSLMEREISAPPNGFHPAADRRIHDLAFDEDAFGIAQYAWAITPDHVVFLGPESNAFNSAAEFESSLTQPPFAIIRGSGVYVNNGGTLSSAVVEEMLLCFRDVAMRAAGPERIHTLTSAEVVDLIGWEAEKYRQTISRVGP